MNKIYALYVVAILALTGCEHDKFTPIGGKGGAASIVVYPQHHGVTASLDSVTVYIKYNTLDAPADGKYDDSAACTYINSMPSCTFSALWNGNYYIYAKGYDYALPGKIRGGLPYTLKAQLSYNFNLPLGEESGY